ncbi:NAD(P)H-dependent oxidoreductase [Mesorhizobium sp. B283B1A]|uniref:NAD(P)H-dependent oxidoreductase n=1 Tax=Mesorhizobium TaxID=68287 RepID=UPI001CD13C47|nr:MULTISPECIES: NAD(P)H-dependent oxidoreductase [Mesorhizobium]MCA0050245.1 NAD(P)H-dependent oxidoreductase [Mesorhizobium sp. B283B1A]UQS66555.1 NAD(P)H-dependent oxidoreductase [Mesorhizobium opportunistum]
MNVLIVYAHPEAKSFNGAMKDMAVETLTRAGHHVVVSDLYAMGFNPVAGPGDISGERSDPDFFSLPREQTAAYEADALSADIMAEIEKLKRADFVLFQFPVWWFGMPAMLKGWADRVFARGFAYLPGRKYDTGMFKGKLAMVAATTGTSADTYAPDGIDGDILTVLWPIHNGLLRYSGFDVLPPFVAYMPGRVGDDGRKAYLEAYSKRLEDIDGTLRLFFHAAEDYGKNERLKPGVLARSGVQRNV